MKMTFNKVLAVVLLSLVLATLAFASPEAVTAGDVAEVQTEGTAILADSSGTCGENLSWTLDDEGTLTISGTGAMGDWWFPSGTPWYNKTVKKVVLKSGVTTIGMSAFENITTLESVEIADSVTEIKTLAFDECISLKEIVLPDSVISIGESAFQQCKKLEKIVLSQNLTSIGNYAFWQCTELESIVIPNKVSSIGSQVFYDCDGLTIYCYANSIAQKYATDNGLCFTTLLGHGTCGENLTWTLDDEGTLTISGTGAMTYNSSTAPWYSIRSSIKKAIIGSGITSIKKEAFSSCTVLESVTIPDSVTSIGQAAFVNCSSLISVEIPNGVEYIGDWAFMGCGQLKKIVIPPSVTVIEEEAFKICHNLTIYGYSGTYAQTFANTVGKPFVCIPPSFSTSMQAYLNLEGLISMSVGYKFNDMESIDPEDYTDKVGLLVWSAASAPEEAQATYENCTNIIEGAIYESEMGRFETTTEGIVAKRLGDQLCFRAYYVDDDGDYVYSKYIKNYSPKTYCYNQIKNNPDDETRIELMVSILNYGAAAQKFFKYNTDNLMNSDLPEELQ